MRRRDFIKLIVGVPASAWPLAAHAEQPAPTIGFFHLTSLEKTRKNLAAFRRGLADTGYIEDKNVTIEHRWADGQNDRLPTLVAELVRRQVSVIVVLESTNGALAAKAATKTIPIVFMQGADPVEIGLVKSLSHPGGNLTGIDLQLARVAGKRLELLLTLVPRAKQIAYLRNPSNPIFAESESKEVKLAAGTEGVGMLIADASTLSEIEKAFSDFTRQHVDALLVSSDGFFLTHPHQLSRLHPKMTFPQFTGGERRWLLAD
jgi:putative ABC transport system substrate-binding protein